MPSTDDRRTDILLDEWQRIRDDRNTACDLLFTLLDARSTADAELAVRRARAYLLASA